MTTFRKLHASGCFVIPNPWDRGSAKLLEALGYRALASTSAGLSFTLGRADAPGAVTLETVLDNLRVLVQATDLPVQADFQDGYADAPSGVYDNVMRCIEVGVAGLSIEDASPSAPLYDLDVAVERVKAARRAIDASGVDVVLTARAESFLVGHVSPLEDVKVRLAAYAEAGADCLYAPGLRTEEQVRTVLDVAGPLPVNVLAANPAWSVEQLGSWGVRRVSIGSAFARVAWAALRQAAGDVAQTGRFGSLGGAMPFADLNALFD